MQKQVRMVVVENMGTCNMRCTYCFPEHMWQRQGHRGAMPQETYRGIVERALSATSHDSVDIHFAGGEPLLAGAGWLEMAMRTARRIAAQHGKRVTFSMQTNANFITPELARLLVANDVTVGVSLDGPPEINEAVRGNTQRTLDGLHILTQVRGRAPGVIVTVTRCNATRMREVIDYLDHLGIALFRANQMGATASWNAHAAPHAEEWAQARQDIFQAVVSHRGQIMEFNLAQAIPKFVYSLLHGQQPFQMQSGCCAMRCPAGRELMYFTQAGQAYPCPRSNVTPEARIGHYADEDFEERWDSVIQQLDVAMTTPTECRRCPAQLVCDYGCHAFNVAQGNFFEVNCDATKDYFQFLTGRLHDVARVFYFLQWREGLKEVDDYASLAGGVDPPPDVIEDLAQQLRERLAERLVGPDLAVEVLARRYGWRDELIPLAALTRRRVSEPSHTPGPIAVLVEGGGN